MFHGYLFMRHYSLFCISRNDYCELNKKSVANVLVHLWMGT